MLWKRRRSGRRTDRRRSQKGIALILTLLVLTLLVILVTQLRLTTRLNVVRARNFTGDLQNVYGVRSGLAFARLYVLVDTELAAHTDHLREPWAQPFTVPDQADASVQVRLEDEERRINLARMVLPDGKSNLVVRGQLMKLVAVLGIPDEKLAPRIADYIDRDAEGEFEGASKNAMLVVPEELAMIPGVLPEHLYGGVDPDTKRPFKGILEFVTLWPVPPPMVAPAAPPPADPNTSAPPPADPNAPPPGPPGAGGLRFGVNVNTAPFEVLLSLSPEMTPELAQGMIAYREASDPAGNPYSFNDIPDLYKVQGMQEQVVQSIQNEIVFRSQVFSARVTSRSRNVTKRVRYVLGRGAAGAPPQLMTWWEEGGAFGLPQRPEGR